MADDNIKRPGQKDQYRPHFDSEAYKASKAESTKPSSEKPTISHLKEGTEIPKIPPKFVLDPNHPSLDTPTYVPDSAKEFENNRANVEKKLTDPIDYKTAKERIGETNKEIDKEIKATQQEITDLLNSNLSPDRMKKELALIMNKFLQASIDINGKYAGFIASKDADARIEASEQRMKELEILKKSKTMTLIGKIFGAISNFFLIIASVYLLVTSAAAATAATALTGGAAFASYAAVVGAGMMLAAAVMGFSSSINELIPEDKRPIPALTGNAATAFFAVQMTFAIVGIILTLGGSAVAVSAQTAAKETALEALNAAWEAGGGIVSGEQAMLIEQLTTSYVGISQSLQTLTATVGMAQNVFNIIQKGTGILTVTGETATKTAKGVLDYQTEMSRAEQIEQQKILSHLQAISESTTNTIRILIQALTDFSKSSSDYFKEERTLGQKISNKVV